VFGALTYDPARRCTVPARDVARAHVLRWLRDTTRGSGPRVEAAVIALEYQKNGFPHFHPLLRVQGGGRAGDFAQLGGPWFREHGFARLESPRSEADVAAYAAKYLAKDLDRGDVLFWPGRGRLNTHQPVLQRRGGS